MNRSQARSARSAAGGQGDGSHLALFSEGALRSGAPGSRLLRAGDREAAIFIPVLQTLRKALREQKLPKANPSG